MASGAAREPSVERQLVERAQRGDHDAFSTLAAVSTDRLYAVAILVLRDRSAAEDAVQEALVRMWRDLPKLRDVDRFRPWLQRLLLNACADTSRSRRRHGAEIQLLPTHELAVGDETTQVANREVLNRAFRHLSIDHRATLVLRHYVGLTVPDVAVAMAVPLGTAKSRLHHAERALRAALEADERSDRSSNEWWSA